MLKEIYEQLTSDREGFLEQARYSSALTIPHLIPPSGTSSSHQELYKPFQSVGAFGVNALANKFALALFPPDTPFFKFQVNLDSEELDGVTPQQLAEIDAKLSVTEQEVMDKFSQRGDRSAIVTAMRHLICAGNALIHMTVTGTVVYGLDSFVCQRDGEGHVLRVITLDKLDYRVFQEMYPGLSDIEEKHKGNRTYTPTSINVYTEMKREKGEWVGCVEAKGVKLKDSYFSAPLDKPPMIVLRYNRIDGQNYGRGYIEDLYGDLRSLESLSKSLVEGAAASAKVVHLVNPNGLTNIRTLANAKNGQYIPGVEGDVGTVKTNKGSDLSITASERQDITSRLEKAFMLTSSAQRQGERVTKYEISQMVEELEQVLGGIYTLLSEEFQTPYVNRLISVLTKQGKIPAFPEGVVEPTIVTGLSAIGRGNDRKELLEFLGQLAQSLGAEAVSSYINVGVAISRLAASSGIDPRGLIKSPEDLAAEQQQAQEAQMMSQAVAPAINGMANVASKQMENQDNAPQEVPA